MARHPNSAQRAELRAGRFPAFRSGRHWVGTLVTLVAMTAVGGASAHADLVPASVEVGGSTRVVARIPNERKGHETTQLTLEFPSGFAIEGAEATGDWVPAIDGGTVTWKGGRIAGDDAVDFALTLTASLAPGTRDVRLEQRYDDGGSVPSTTLLTVLPALGENAPDVHVGRAIVAAAIGLIVVVGSLLALRAMRRRRSPAGKP